MPNWCWFLVSAHRFSHTRTMYWLGLHWLLLFLFFLSLLPWFSNYCIALQCLDMFAHVHFMYSTVGLCSLIYFCVASCNSELFYGSPWFWRNGVSFHCVLYQLCTVALTIKRLDLIKVFVHICPYNVWSI